MSHHNTEWNLYWSDDMAYTSEPMPCDSRFQFDNGAVVLCNDHYKTEKIDEHRYVTYRSPNITITRWSNSTAYTPEPVLEDIYNPYGIVARDGEVFDLRYRTLAAAQAIVQSQPATLSNGPYRICKLTIIEEGM